MQNFQDWLYACLLHFLKITFFNYPPYAHLHKIPDTISITPIYALSFLLTSRLVIISSSFLFRFIFSSILFIIVFLLQNWGWTARSSFPSLTPFFKLYIFHFTLHLLINIIPPPRPPFSSMPKYTFFHLLFCPSPLFAHSANYRLEPMIHFLVFPTSIIP